MDRKNLESILFWERGSDFFIKIVILFVAYISLLYFSQYYNRFELVYIALLLTIAMIIKGITGFIKNRGSK